MKEMKEKQTNYLTAVYNELTIEQEEHEHPNLNKAQPQLESRPINGSSSSIQFHHNHTRPNHNWGITRYNLN